jgi:hypothetical protein
MKENAAASIEPRAKITNPLLIALIMLTITIIKKYFF